MKDTRPAGPAPGMIYGMALSPTKARITWSTVPAANGYQLYRSGGGSSSMTLIHSVAATPGLVLAVDPTQYGKPVISPVPIKWGGTSNTIPPIRYLDPGRTPKASYTYMVVATYPDTGQYSSGASETAVLAMPPRAATGLDHRDTITGHHRDPQLAAHFRSQWVPGIPGEYTDNSPTGTRDILRGSGTHSRPIPILGGVVLCGRGRCGDPGRVEPASNGRGGAQPVCQTVTHSLHRREFIRNASRLAAGLGCLSSGAGDLLARVARSGRTRLLSADTRPFNILAFGDSIMWGQGLAHDSKFATLVKNWVGANLPGRTLTFQNLAHSGAIIQPGTTQDAATGWDGEVPSPYPSIHKQLHRARDAMVASNANPAEIDLVLLNGGANDVGITKILGPWTSSGGVTDLTVDAVGNRMAYLLPIAAGLFPNAKFIVPGYFPIITADSSTPEVTILLTALFGPLGLALTPAIKSQLIANSTAFYESADSGLRKAVDEQNSRTPNRCVFADPGFSMYNGYGASQRCLFNVGESDPMVNARKMYCAAAGQEFDPLCAGASMGHPNINGALKYAGAMTGKLGIFLAEWQGLRKLFACVEPRPVIGSPATYTVWVEDYLTRLPVAATVAVGSQTVSANTSFSYTFGCSAPETESTPGLPGKPSRTAILPGACDRITISAPGYISTAVRY